MDTKVKKMFREEQKKDKQFAFHAEGSASAGRSPALGVDAQIYMHHIAKSALETKEFRSQFDGDIISTILIDNVLHMTGHLGIIRSGKSSEEVLKIISTDKCNRKYGYYSMLACALSIRGITMRSMTITMSLAGTQFIVTCIAEYMHEITYTFHNIHIFYTDKLKSTLSMYGIGDKLEYVVSNYIHKNLAIHNIVDKIKYNYMSYMRNEYDTGICDMLDKYFPTHCGNEGQLFLLLQSKYPYTEHYLNKYTDQYLNYILKRMEKSDDGKRNYRLFIWQD